MVTNVPSYELLIVELQATLEALIKYSKSDYVRQSAIERKKQIERIKKNKEGLYISDVGKK